MEGETTYALKGSHGGLQGRFQRVAHNLHFTRQHTTMTTMGIPSIVAFEVEVVELNFKYEKGQALRRLEKLRQMSRGKNSKVVKLPSIGLSYEGIAIATFIETKPTICTCPNLFNS
jgi:hypothetical protein